MKILGLHVPFTKRPLPAVTKTLASVYNGPNVWTPIFESFPGAWQKNIKVDRETAFSHYAQFACISLIASDISKLRVKLIGEDEPGLWLETSNSAYDGVLRKPNDFQTRNQFWANWITCKLMFGNVYVLKQRDGGGTVRKLYVLDPKLVKVLVSDDGAVFYEISPDNIAGVKQSIIVPAREIIHDRFNCFFHPLVGLPPIFANGLASMNGLAIQNFSSRFFTNDATPAGLLSVPGPLATDQGKDIQQKWEAMYGGKNAGKIAVLGHGTTFTTLAMKSVDSQMIEQLKLTAEIVCSCYHVPPYKIAAAAPQTASNVQALNLEYYSQCLQSLIEEAETCLDEGLGLNNKTGVEFDTDALLRMDTPTQIEAYDKAVKGALMKPNEARKKLGLPRAAGADELFLQQQNYSLSALAKRDAREDPFATSNSGGTKE